MNKFILKRTKIKCVSLIIYLYNLKVTSTEVFWPLILNHQHDLHAKYHIVCAIAMEDKFIQPLRQECARE